MSRRSPLGACARAAVVVLLVATGCAHQPVPVGGRRAFRFPEDTFAFENDTAWSYVPDAATGRLLFTPKKPSPAFALQCGNLVRTARQFLVHARFDPSLPRVSDATYAALLREVMARDPRAQHPPPDPIVVPGYADLHGFSADHAAMVKRLLFGPWTFLQRGNWRMIFPFPSAGQREEAERIAAEVRAGDTPIVHVLRFPIMSINHIVLVYGVDETPTDIAFRAYDPNDASTPLVLRWDRAARTFTYPGKHYFLGGPVRAYEIFHGLLY